MYQLFCLREAIRTGSNLCYCGECKWCGMGDVVHSAGRVLYMDREWSDFLCFYLIRYNYAVKNTGLEFISGSFIGCFVTFAAGGDGKLVIPTLLLGILLGWMTDLTGEWMFQKSDDKNKNL